MNVTSIAVDIILVLNVLWFGAGFWQFSLRPDAAAKGLVPKSAWGAPLFRTISTSIQFLGGMNFAFSAFAALLLANRSLFPEARQVALFATVFALAHGSQFVVNVPVALRGGRQGESLWPVLSGPMLFIFIVDFTLMAANGLLAALCLAHDGV